MAESTPVRWTELSQHERELFIRVVGRFVSNIRERGPEYDVDYMMLKIAPAAIEFLRTAGNGNSGSDGAIGVTASGGRVFANWRKR